MSILRHQYQMDSGQVIEIRQGDLTQESCDAIVNAANSYLSHGGGVAGAIVRAGGYEIQAESDRWVEVFGSVPTGQVAVTRAGKLPCHWVIHAVGPVWNGGGEHEDELLGGAVQNSLRKAEELKLSCVALPAISSGIFGFPKERCATIMVETALDFCRQNPQSSLRLICMTNIDLPTVAIFEAALKEAEKGIKGGD